MYVKNKIVGFLNKKISWIFLYRNIFLISYRHLNFSISPSCGEQSETRSICALLALQWVFNERSTLVTDYNMYVCMYTMSLK